MLEAGDNIDIWVVEKRLGAGGMGSVYRCHNRTATRILAAIKVLESSLRTHPEAEARFIREAEILFQLDHQNIVKVRNVRTDTEPPYLEMEFVEGESMEGRLQRGAVPLADALQLMGQIAEAIGYLHAKGIRHRDIKPANLLIDKAGTVKLVDFGLAVETDITRITQQGMAFGTVSYAPPEWITPDKLDPERWDIYACGVVFYEMLTGKLAFPVSGQGSARQQAMQVIVSKQNAPPLDPGEAFPQQVRNLVRAMTHKDPTKRPRQASDVAAIVQKLKGGAGDKSDLPEEFPVLSDTDAGSVSTWTTDVGAPKRATLPPTSMPPAEMPPTTGNSGPTLPLDLYSRNTIPPVGQRAPRRRTAALFAVLGGVALVAGSAAVGLLLTGLVSLYAAGDRPVSIVVAGLPANTDVDLLVNGAPPGGRDGFTFHFSEQAPGPVAVRWAVGSRCQAASCPGAECPAWCGSGTATQELPSGRGAYTMSLTLPDLPRRKLRITTPKVWGDWERGIELIGDQKRDATVEEDGSAVLEDVLPGRYQLKVNIGACEAKDRDCAHAGHCPPGCTSWVDKQFTVPWGDGPHTARLDDVTTPEGTPPSVAVPPPPVSAALVVTPKPEPKPAPEAPKPAPKALVWVTYGDFAAWLTEHAAYQRDEALASGRAAGSYLQGWSAADPPSGVAAGAPITNVSWFAAKAYCQGRGGLPNVDDEPVSWPEGGGVPLIQFRENNGNPAYRSNYGTAGTSNVKGTFASTMAGFACAR